MSKVLALSQHAVTFLCSPKKYITAFRLLAILAYFCVGASNAWASSAIRSSCWAAGTLSENILPISHQKQRWICNAQKPSIKSERVLLRFDIPQGNNPRYFLSRRSALQTVHFIVVDQNGAVRRTSVPADALYSSVAGGYFKAPLPTVTQATRQIVVAIDLPSHKMTLEQAYLTPKDAGGNRDDLRGLLVLGGLAGMLVMPLIYNAAFYRVLREPFVLWHSALTLSLLLTILVSSGLSVALFNPPAMVLSWMTTIIFGMSIASGAMFTKHFIEPELMHPHLRQMLPYCAVLAIYLSTYHAAFPFVGRANQSSLYTAAFAPILFIFMISMVDALRRGSRAAKFQAIGYTPIILVGVIRLITGTVPWLQNTDAMLMFYLGCVFEVLLTTFGVADRFQTIKRQRDRTRIEADLFERLAETDPLTGLLNRRSIEREFKALQASGFSTLALLDLDHFKRINDVSGHAVGDEVLKATAHALNANTNMRAYRFGGEEFMLLLRGEKADLHAEFIRQSIPAHVAQCVQEIDRPVTASMGITEILANEDFLQPYKRADKALYDAKRKGRNKAQCALVSSLAKTTHPQVLTLSA